MKGITAYGPGNSRLKTGVVIFNVKNMSCEEVCEKLSTDYGIASRGGYHCAPLAHKTIGTYETGAVRLSVGPFNTKREINTAIEAVYQIQKV